MNEAVKIGQIAIGPVLKLPSELMKPFFELDPTNFLLGIIVLTLTHFIILGYSGSPEDCQLDGGTCRLIFSKTWQITWYMNVLVTTFVMAWLTARGVKKHGLRPLAFLMPISLVVVFGILSLVFIDISKYAVDNQGIVDTSRSSPAMSFIDIFRALLYYLVTRFNLSAGQATMEDPTGTTFVRGPSVQDESWAFWGPAIGVIIGSLGD